MAITTNLSVQYKLGIKRQIINALRKGFGAAYPDAPLRNHVAIETEYPLHEITYPMVTLTLNPGTISNIGIGHKEIEFDTDGIPQIVKRWRFDGSFTLNVYAKTPMDRDMVILGLLNMFAFGDEIQGFGDFWQEIHEDDYVALQINTDHVQEGGDQVVTVPWSDDETPIFTDSLTFNFIGEFWTDPTTGDLVVIETVNTFPYPHGAPEPQGANDPAPWLPGHFTG